MKFACRNRQRQHMAGSKAYGQQSKHWLVPSGETAGLQDAPLAYCLANDILMKSVCNMQPLAGALYCWPNKHITSSYSLSQLQAVGLSNRQHDQSGGCESQHTGPVPVCLAQRSRSHQKTQKLLPVSVVHEAILGHPGQIRHNDVCAGVAVWHLLGGERYHHIAELEWERVAQADACAGVLQQLQAQQLRVLSFARTGGSSVTP